MAMTEISVQSIIDKFSVKTAELTKQLVMTEIQRDTLFNQVVELKVELEKLESEIKELKAAVEKPKKDETKKEKPK